MDTACTLAGETEVPAAMAGGDSSLVAMIFAPLEQDAGH